MRPGSEVRCTDRDPSSRPRPAIGSGRPPERVEGLGLLPHSNCVHYDAEPERRVAFRRFVDEGMAPGYAADDGVALHFVGSELAHVVASRSGRHAYRVTPGAETPLEARHLGKPALVAA